MSHVRGSRVLFVDNTYTFGGAITSLGHLVNGLRQQGVGSVVVTGQPQELLESLMPHTETVTLELELPWAHGDPFVEKPSSEAIRRLGPIKRRLRTLYWAFLVDGRWARRYAAYARDFDCDLIHLNNGALVQVDGGLAAKLARIPCVSHHRGWRSRTTDFTWMEALRFRIPDHHIAVSGEVASTLTGPAGEEAKVTVVHDAVDLDTFFPDAEPEGLRAELGIPTSAPVVGHFGRVTPWKGTLEFVRAFSRAARRHGNLCAIVVGDPSDGTPEYMDAVKREVDRLGLGNRVILCGYRPDVPSLMRMCTLVVHSSITPEPFGMVIAEAMACGKPVVAADRGGPLEIIREGVDGFLVDPRSPDAMSEAMLAILEDPELRERMGAAAEARAREHFSKERYAREVMAVYERVLAR